MKTLSLEVSLNGETLYTLGADQWQHMEVEVQGVNFAGMGGMAQQAQSGSDHVIFSLDSHLFGADIESSPATADTTSNPLELGDEVRIRLVETEARNPPKVEPPEPPPMNEQQVTEYLHMMFLQWFESGADRILLENSDNGNFGRKIGLRLEIGGELIHEILPLTTTWDGIISALISMKSGDTHESADLPGPIRISTGNSTEIVFHPALAPGETASEKLTFVCRLSENTKDEFQARRTQWMAAAIPPEGIGIEHTLGLALSVFQPHSESPVIESFSKEGIATLRSAAITEINKRRDELDRFRYLADFVYYELEPDELDASGAKIDAAFSELHGHRQERYAVLMDSLSELDQAAFKRLISQVQIYDLPSNNRCLAFNVTLNLGGGSTVGRAVKYRLANGKPLRESTNSSAQAINMCAI